MAREEIRRIESLLSRRPDTQPESMPSNTARFLVGLAGQGLSSYYNNYMEESNKLYKEKIEQEARYAKSGDEFIKRVDQVITPQYKSDMLFSQAHGRTAARVPLMAREIDLINERKLNDLNTSNFLTNVSKLTNKSIDYQSFEEQAKTMLNDYTRANGDLDAVGTQNYENILNTARTSFDLDAKNKAVTTYLKNAITAFGSNPDAHYRIENFINFIEKDIGKNVGGSPTLMKEALSSVMQFVPSHNMADELIKRYGGSFNDMEKSKMKAIASTGIEQAQYRERKQLEELRLRVQENLEVGLSTTDPNMVEIITQEEQILNDFALKQNLAQRSPDFLHIMYNEMGKLRWESQERIKKELPGLKTLSDTEKLIEAQNWFSKLVQGRRTYTDAELQAKEAIEAMRDAELKQDYLKRVSAKFYKDFSKDFVEAIQARNPNVTATPLVIPLLDEKGVLYGKDEFLQSMMARKTLFDYYSTMYQDTEALNNPYSAEEITQLNNIFSKLDPNDALDLANSMSKIWGKQNAQEYISKASGDLALAQAITMNTVEGGLATAPTSEMYKAYSNLRKNDPDKLKELADSLERQLNAASDVNISYLDPMLKNKVQWLTIGNAALNHGGNIAKAFDETIHISRKRLPGQYLYERYGGDSRFGEAIMPVNKIGAVLFTESDFINFRKEIGKYKTLTDLRAPNATWVNNGDSHKEFVLMEMGDDGVLRPYMEPTLTWDPRSIEWSKMFTSSTFRRFSRGFKESRFAEFLGLQYTPEELPTIPSTSMHFERLVPEVTPIPFMVTIP